MRIGVPIILFLAVAGFHNVISASLKSDESNDSSEEREYVENSTTLQPDDSQYAAAHVKGDHLRATRMNGERQTVSNNTDESLYAAARVEDGETGAVSDNTETLELSIKAHNDEEAAALTGSKGATTGSDKPIILEIDSEEETSPQKTDHSEQTEENGSPEDVTEEGFNGSYEY